MKRIIGLTILSFILILLSCTSTPPSESGENDENRVVFGTYEQDNDLTNGAEPIEWIVLEREEDGSMLLIARLGLDCMQYHEKQAEVTWETCSLRSWLNEEFYNTAFTEEEKKQILVTTVPNKGRNVYGIDGGSDTEDRVYLLSAEEASGLFDSDEARQAMATKYAIRRGVRVIEEPEDSVHVKGTAMWWLRGPGYTQDSAANVMSWGYVIDTGQVVNKHNVALRPVIRIRDLGKE